MIDLKVAREGMHLYLIADGRKVMVTEVGPDLPSRLEPNGTEIIVHTVWNPLAPGWSWHPVALISPNDPDVDDPDSVIQTDAFAFEGKRLIALFRIDENGDPHVVIAIPPGDHIVN